MNAKMAKLLRKRIKEVFDVDRIGQGVTQNIARKEIKNADGVLIDVRVQAVLDIKSPRGLYQRTKRITQGQSHRRSARGKRSIGAPAVKLSVSQ